MDDWLRSCWIMIPLTHKDVLLKFERFESKVTDSMRSLGCFLTI